MINVKKGPAHSLGQADTRGKAPAAGGITSGMVCYVNTSGSIVKGSVPNGSTGLAGFAVNNSTDGDVVESGRIGLYTLDGTSVIETDQAALTVNSTNYPVGNAVYADSDGLVTTVSTAHAGPIGWVEGIRSLQADGNTAVTQDYVSIYDTSGTVSGTQATISSGSVQRLQRNVSVVSIKLAAGNPTV